MGIVAKILKYSSLIAFGYYLGSCSDIQNSELEKEVVKYEQKIVQDRGEEIYKLYRRYRF